MRILATPLTSGNAAPGKEQPGSRTWRWHGKPPGWPFDPATHDDKGVRESPKGGAKVRQADRLKRSAEYALIRDQGGTHDEAVKEIGVARKTGARYKADWLAIPCGHDFRESCSRCTERQQALARARGA